MPVIKIADVFIRDFHEFVLYELTTPDVYPILPKKHGSKPYPEDTTQTPRYYVSWNDSKVGFKGVPSLTLWCVRTNLRVTVGEPKGWESWWDREEDNIEPADVLRHVVDILYRDVIKGAGTHVERLLTPALCKQAVEVGTMFDSTVTEPSYSESRDSPGSRSESTHLEDAFNPHVSTDSNMTRVSPAGGSPTWMQELHTDSEDTANDTVRGRKTVRFKPSTEWERRSVSAGP